MIFFVFVKKKLDVISRISCKAKAQDEDSAFSVHFNIAEGYGKRYLIESIQMNSITFASMAENYSQLYALMKAEIVDQIGLMNTIHYTTLLRIN